MSYDYFKKPPAPEAVEGATNKTYGNTWWGRRWLEALKGIDHSNRLARGKIYANKGLVKQLEIKDGSISAFVQGTAPEPYEVSLRIPWFNEGHRRRTVKLVTKNPIFLSKLLNRELPPELEEELRKSGVHLFPRRWQEISGMCSCPDWVVPCKHMAAVLYVVANEIDKNPFLIFDLHNFDLLEALEKRGVSQSAVSEVNAAQAAALQQDIEHTIDEEFVWDEAALEALDFSKIPPNCSDDLLRLLSEKPVFYPEGDFKKILASVYRALRRQPDSQPEPLTAEEHHWLMAAESAMIVQDSRTGAFWGGLLLDQQGETLLDCETEAQWVNFWERLSMADLALCSPKLRSMHMVYQFARQLALRGAFVPQLIEVSETEYRIRYVPALLNEAVRSVFEKVKKWTAPGLLTYVDETGQTAEPTEADALIALIALFLRYFIAESTQKIREESPGSIPEWFLTGHTMAFENFEQREYPKAIQLWLNRFFIAEKRYVPVFEVRDDPQTLEFEVRVSIEDRDNSIRPLIPLKHIFNKKQYDEMRLEVLSDLANVVEFFPPLAQHINSKGATAMRFHAQDFPAVLFDMLPIIRLLGIRVMLPRSLRRLSRPHLSMKLTSKGQVNGKGLLSFAQIIHFQWQVALGGKILTPEEFVQMARRMRGIVRLNHAYVFLDEYEVAALLNQLENAPEPSPMQLLQIALTERYQGARVFLEEELRRQIEVLLKPEAVPLPEGLTAQLRPYQQRGYEWLYKNIRLGVGSLIADDMGLGKTVQVITALLRMREDGALDQTKKALVVVPTTLLTNWVNEIHKFAPSLRYALYHGPDRSWERLNGAEVVLTTYGILRTDVEKINEHPLSIVVLDEAQNIKNADAAQTKAAKKLNAPLRIAMTGTPVENRLSEYYSIFEFINSGLLGSPSEFLQELARPIETERNHEALERFRKITSPFLLRRVKTDKNIINDLPEKIETNQYCLLTPEQAALYQSAVEEMLQQIAREDEKDIRRQGLVLKMLTALKQICNHPAQYLKKGLPEPSLSGKAQRLLELLDEILAAGEKALIFTQYREMGDLLVPMLRNTLGLDVPFLHGGCTREQRDQMVEQFQKHHATRVLLLSLKAGGIGLNLTAATNVIHYDLWWNPAVEAQATDRAYRIGQERNVLVHRLITQGTLEEKIDQMIQRKKELADLTVTVGEKWLGELSNDELREVVQLSH
ncbi:MAG: DEAD/DEAH box helicase [Saprospiraceae bacterium]|nr:DEAD/DEAH box helicase [Saprospiraceae bacterium]MDW8482911.1 DEAD/DEAH box helicase [Saprospiraceae bacterium]